MLADNGLRIIPHIVLGLHYGKFLGEYHALDMVTEYPVSTLILVVLTHWSAPRWHTCHRRPRRRHRILRHRTPSRTGDPGQPWLRPADGPSKVDLDQAAVDLGLNGIAYPADGVIGYAESRGLIAARYEYCCSLTWRWRAARDGAYAEVQAGPT